MRAAGTSASTSHPALLGAELFSDPGIEFVHTRNVHAGCYMFAITRADG